MEKVRIVALEEDKSNVVAALHQMGIIDLRKSKLEAMDDRPASYSTEISDSLIKVNGALQILPEKEVREEKHIAVGKLISEAKGMKALGHVYELNNEERSIEEDNASLDNAEHIATAFQDLKVDFSRIKSDRIAYKAFEGDSKALKAFRKKVKEKEGIETYVSKAGKRYLVFVAYERKNDLESIIKDIGFSELDLTARYIEGRPKDVLEVVRKKRSANAKRSHEITHELEQLSSRNYSHLSNMSEMLGIELSRADASAMFKRTESTFIAEGWIEKRRFDTLSDKLLKITRGKVQVEAIPHDELAPTQTNRPGFLKPFEYLMNFYSTQRSDEIDPTWIFVLSFPIFYGLMVSDVGYGIASLLFVTYISTRVNKEGLVYNACKIWQTMSVAAIFFGVLSNEYFGFQLNQYIIPGFTGFSWLKDATVIIAITILFGITQIVIGLLFGFINHWKRGHRKMAVSKLTSIAAILFGTVAVSALFGLTSGNLPLYSAVVSVAAILITAAISGHEATEITNLITHPLSYARIMGFGLGSVIIALLIDTYFTPHLSAGILVFIVYLIIFILLHFLNMILGIFEGIVQGVRLNFVEFFSKFYIGNGIRFRPFSYKRVHTKEEKNIGETNGRSNRG